MNDYAISSKILADNGVMPERISAFLLWRMLVTRSSDNQYFDWACSDFETGEMLGFVRTDLYGYPCGQTGDGSFHFEIGAVVQRLVVCESLPLMADYLATKPEDNCCFLLAHEVSAVREAMECYDQEGVLVCELEEHIHDGECFRIPGITEEQQQAIEQVSRWIADFPEEDEILENLAGLEEADKEDR